MRKSIERIIEEKLKLEELVVEILSDAAYAERFISKPSKLGRFFGFHRVTIKRRYETLLDKLCIKLKNNFDNFDKIFN
jgi:hypothetical protein